MKFAATTFAAFLLAIDGVLQAQGFVYPVGNSTEQPARTYPNSNGYRITRGFGDFADPQRRHTAVDLANGPEGGAVRAIGHGTVSLRKNESESAGLGNVVLIRHDLVEGTYYSLYAHMEDVSANVGDIVEAGTPVGKVGCSGPTMGQIHCLNGGSGPHLHFAIKKVGALGCGYISAKCMSGDTFDNYVDPLNFIQSHLAPALVILQPSPETGKDIWTTSVYSYAPCSNPGPGGGLYDSELRVGGWGDWYYSLLQFDLTGLPPHATSATLQLYCYSNNGGTTTPMHLDYITQFWWDWQTMGNGCDHERLWWADRPPTVQWSATALPAPVVGAWDSVDITGLYNAWQTDQYPNYGLQLRPLANSDNFNFFYSSRYTDDATLRPKLVVQP